MKNRISLAIFLLLMSLYSWAQIGGDYNPSNPSDPGNPTQEYTLTLKATPSNGGSFNTTSTNLAGGKTYTLRAYPSTDFAFVAWLCNGDTLSKASSYTYTMPYHDVEIIGVFTYSPSNPSDPNVVAQKYTLTMKATPTEGGSFNTNSTKVSVGEWYNLRAYPNTDFAFVAWLCEGDTLSKSASYDYTMPAHNVDIMGVFTYRPSSPSDPQEQALKYQLSLTATPMNSGSFNISNERLAVGSNNSLRAYANTDFVFKHWMIGDSVLSTNPNMDFVMPSHNVQMVGVFEYNPASPANPNRNHWDKQTGEVIVDDFSPGYLSSAISSVISGSSSNDVQMIIVAGRITSNDFGIANNYKNCSLLDLSRVTGVTEVSSYAFDYTNLETVYLPATIEKIGARAFAECTKLSSLTIYAMTPPTLESQVFQGVPEGLVVYVPAAAIAQYQDVEAWGKFTLLPIQEDIRSISISLPEGANAADYTQMWLELTNTKSGQHMHYVMTDRMQYTFANIIRNTSWNVTLRNERGDVFGQIDNVEVKDEDVSVAFAKLSKPQNVSLSVLTPDGTNVTEQVQVTWTDSQGNYVAQGTSLSGLPAGYKVNYRLTLSQDLAMAYGMPAASEYTLKDGSNTLTCQLQAIGKVQLSGKVKDVSTGLPLSGAVVSASQTFGGKYSKTLVAKTDAKGEYMMEVYNVPTSVAFAATDYISQTVDLSNNELHDLNELEDVKLKPISGAVITLNFTYTPTVGEGETAETQNWYSDYQNVGYTLYNKTRKKAIKEFSVQYPQIVLLEEVSQGDIVELTAESKTSAFMPVRATATISEEQTAEATFNIVELGRIQAEYSQSGNVDVTASLYDADGKLVKTFAYQNMQLTISNLADGEYTLVSMGNSQFFNSIYNLAQLPQTGLKQGTDYVQHRVSVKSGEESTVYIDLVPKLDESKLYYTGDNTSFTVNKPSIVAGNYLTLTGHIDFKPAYATNVSNVQMIVDLPENCQFVENSVMVGNSTSSYTLNGSRITIPMARYTDRVRFCIIPTLGGDYAPSAFAQFDLNGETVTQPIGSANYTAKDLSISVPSTVAKTSIPVSGTSIGQSSVEIYDNGVLIGQTTSMSNGTWATTCELNEPYNLSTHSIYAKVTSKQGLDLKSEVKIVQYDKNAVEVSKVTMTNTAHPSGSLNLCQYTTVFDFQKSQSSIPAYWYWPSYPDFTFIVEFTNNDTTIVSDIVLHVFTTSGVVRNLHPVYDEKLDAYVVSDKFNSNALPETVSVSFNANTKIYGDAAQVADAFDNAKHMIEDVTDENVNSLLNQLDEIGDETQDDEIIEELYNSLNIRIESIEVTDFDAQLKNFEDNIEFPDVPLVLSDGPLDIISNGNHCHLSVSTYSENEGNIDISDFIPSELNDGTIVYYRANDGLYEFINIKEDIYVRLYTRNDGSTSSARRISGMDVLQAFVTAFDNYETTIEGLNKDINAHRLELLAKINGSIAKYTSELNEVESLLKWMRANETAAQYRLTYESLIRQRRAILNALAPFKAALRAIGAIFKAINIWSAYEDAVYAGESLREWIEIIRTIESIDCPGMEELAQEAMGYAKSVGTGYAATLAADVATLSSLKTSLSCGVAAAITLAIGDFAIIQGGINKINDIRWKSRIRNKIPVLKCKPDDPNPPKPHEPRVPHVMDPSGYVYEGVTSNRIEGVTATAYYKEMIEDMYGDLHENIVKWDASEYAQENPLFTDEYGMYAWDVLNGLWQVKFEKEGYETTYSEWLPVPPPQLDVNIAMKQNRQPEVKAARAYEDAVEVEFDKYMMTELLTAENIMVMQNGTAVEGTIELLNEEVAGWRAGAPALQEQAGAGSDLSDGNEETFASKIRFNAKKPFTAKEVTLMVNNRVKSYAGIRMQDNYEQTFAVEEEIKEIACDAMKVVGYGESSKLVVQVLPASASKGKMLNVKTSSPMILSVDKEQVTIGNDGKAVITMTGELPGTAALTFTVEGTDKEGLTVASVEADVIKGDVNGDRLVNGTDIVALVNVIMSSTEYPGNPDVNGDGLVNGTDLVALVNIIMGAKTARAASMARGAESPASLSVEKFNVNAGGTKKMLIDVNNQGMDVTMVEFNMKLPSGLTVAKENGALAVDIAGRTDYKSHQLETTFDDGVLHVLLHSDQNSVLTGNDGAVLSVRLVANQEIVNGEIVLEQQLLTAPDLTESKPEKYIYGLGTATGIAEIEDGRQTTEDSVYDLQGRKSNEAQAGKGIIIKNRKKVAKY